MFAEGAGRQILSLFTLFSLSLHVLGLVRKAYLVAIYVILTLFASCRKGFIGSTMLILSLFHVGAPVRPGQDRPHNGDFVVISRRGATLALLG